MWVLLPESDSCRGILFESGTVLFEVEVMWAHGLTLSDVPLADEQTAVPGVTDQGWQLSTPLGRD